MLLSYTFLQTRLLISCDVIINLLMKGKGVDQEDYGMRTGIWKKMLWAEMLIGMERRHYICVYIHIYLYIILRATLWHCKMTAKKIFGNLKATRTHPFGRFRSSSRRSTRAFTELMFTKQNASSPCFYVDCFSCTWICGRCFSNTLHKQTRYTNWPWTLRRIRSCLFVSQRNR